MKSSKAFALLSLIGIATLLIGCGPSKMQMEQMEQIRATADEALRTANTADYNAAVAKDLADEAMTMMQSRKMMKGKKMMMKKYKK